MVTFFAELTCVCMIPANTIKSEHFQRHLRKVYLWPWQGDRTVSQSHSSPSLLDWRVTRIKLWLATWTIALWLHVLAENSLVPTATRTISFLYFQIHPKIKLFYFCSTCVIFIDISSLHTLIYIYTAQLSEAVDTPTASLQRGKTPNLNERSGYDIKTTWLWGFSPGTLGSAEYPFIDIAPRFTLAWIVSTR